MDARERRPILLVRTAVSPLATQNFNVDELLSTFHLNSLATRRDHEIFGSFPRASIGDVGVAPLPWTVHGYGGSGQFMVQPFVFDGREVAQRRVAA